MIFEILEQISESETIAVNKSIRELKRLKKAHGGGRWRKIKETFINRFQSEPPCRCPDGYPPEFRKIQSAQWSKQSFYRAGSIF